MKALSFILQLMICFGFSSIANAQIANYNFVYVSHFFSSSQNTSTHSKEPQIEIIYYNDSIPPLKWFDQYDTISGGVPFGAFEKQVTKEPDTIIESRPRETCKWRTNRFLWLCRY